MAVGRRPELTLPNLVYSNFLDKNDPTLFWILISSDQKNLIGSYLAGRQPCVCPKQPTSWGPNYIKWQFFHLLYPI